ncbi:MAG: hypothetical protein JXJ22_17035 [Bacteroidales bacterium]|nr:hypothetical protein [Bacteroidales bacterium]
MIILFLTQFFLSTLFHPVHVSITSVEIDTENQSLEFYTKLYYNDLWGLMLHFYNIDLDQNPDSTINDQELTAVNKYMYETIKITVNGKQLKEIKFVKKERDEESVWLYYKALIPEKKINRLVIENRLFNELYYDQKNLIIVTFDGEQQGYTCTYENFTINVKL